MSCIDPTTLERFARGDVTAEARVRIEGHIATCATCRRSSVDALLAEEDTAFTPRTLPPDGWQRARRLAPTPRQQTGRLERRGKGHGARRGWLIAAGLLMAAGLGWIVARPGGEAPTSVTRTATPAHALHLVSPVDDARVLRAGLLLRWQSLPEATSYRVQVLDRLGDVLLDRTTHETALAPPDDLDLPPGEPVFWRAGGILPGGAEVWSTINRLTVE